MNAFKPLVAQISSAALDEPDRFATMAPSGLMLMLALMVLCIVTGRLSPFSVGLGQSLPVRIPGLAVALGARVLHPVANRVDWHRRGPATRLHLVSLRIRHQLRGIGC